MMRDRQLILPAIWPQEAFDSFGTNNQPIDDLAIRKTLSNQSQYF
jgi:hypothetical protein